MTHPNAARSPVQVQGVGPPSLVRWATLFYVLLALVAIGWNGWAGTPWAFIDPAAEAAGVRWGRDIALGLSTAAVVIAVSHLVTTRTAWGEALARELARAIGPLTGSEVLRLAVLSGFAEEAFFRGALQPRVGWLAASLIFGLVHVAPSRSLLPWTGFAIVAGGLLGGLYLATGNLLAPVLAHAGINAVNLRLLGARYGNGA
jgi:membrane protease YdiL (CAAX protease family)